MKQLKLLCLTLTAVVAAFAAASTSALAVELPENEPALGAGETRTFTGNNVTATVTTLHAEGQEPVSCTAAPAEGTEETSKPPKGAFHIKFENCTSKAGGVTVKCTGLGDVTGVILALGTWALVFDKLIGKPFENLTSAVLFKNEAVHFTCGGLVLVEVIQGGETLCLHLNPLTLSAKHEFHCIGEIAGGKPKPLEEWGSDVGAVFTNGKVPVLLASINHGADVPALQLGLGVTTTFKAGVETAIKANQ